MNAETILVIAAHPDDEVLGAGGTIARRVREGHQVHVAYLATGITGRDENQDEEDARAEINALYDDARRAGGILGVSAQHFLGFPDNRLDTVPRMDIAHALKKIVNEIRPGTVFTHHHGDYNWDHRIAFEAAMMACRACPGETFPSTILSYEVPSSTERAFQSPAFSFCPTTYVDISESLEQKIAALEAYAGELGEYPHPRSGKALTHLAAKRGNEVALQYAEAFCLIRHISPDCSNAR